MARFVVVLLAIVMLSGCGLISISTNIPFLNGSGTTLIATNSSDYLVTISVNGREQEFEFPPKGGCSNFVKPGQSVVIKKTNWNTQPDELTIIAKAWSNDGTYIGVTSVKMYVYNQYNTSDPWNLCNNSFSRCCENEWRSRW